MKMTMKQGALALALLGSTALLAGEPLCRRSAARKALDGRHGDHRQCALRQNGLWMQQSFRHKRQLGLLTPNFPRPQRSR